MKICVLGGSPKGENSVTMQYVRYLEKRFPEHTWRREQIASRIALLEKDEERFSEVVAAVGAADLVLWAFPLYYLTVCSQYKRFIELVERRGQTSAFAGKYAASLSTSIHFYDHTAHAYIGEVSEDWGMRLVSSYAAAMNDLMKEGERFRLDAFAEDLFAVAGSSQVCPRVSAPLLSRKGASPADGLPALAAPAGAVPGAADSGGFLPSGCVPVKASVLVDMPDSPAGRMAVRAGLSLAAAGAAVERVDLGMLGLEHGCLGCLKCGAGECAYTGKDAFIETFRSKVMASDVLVFAGNVRDRSLSWLWKAFLDRSFFNTHRPSLEGKRVVMLVSGPLSQLANLREIWSSYFEVMGAQLVSFVSDEAEGPELLAASIDGSVGRAVRAVERERSEGLSPAACLPPATFRGVAGMKLFRDEIYGSLKIVFKGDHREYRKSKRYDFPLRNPISRFAVWLGFWITSVPFIQKGMRANMTTFMIKPYAPVLERTAPKRPL